MPDRDALRERIVRVLAAFGRDAEEWRGAQRLGEPIGEWAARVLEWNRRIDLTAARSDDELVDLLLADAAAISAAIGPARAASWVDVGAGAGAPGIALALLAPELSVTLVEPKTKRVAFLRSTIGALRLERVSVERGRSEALPARAFDVAISRATLPPAEWLAEGTRLARGSVWLLLARGEPPELSLGRVTRDLRYMWPLTGLERRAIEYVVESETG